MRQGEPLSCHLVLVILLTVVIVDARERYDAECVEKGMSAVQRKTSEGASIIID